MLRTLLFKTTLFIYFVLWTPLLLISLVSKRLSRFFVYTEAAGVLVLARLITGIKYQVHYPKTDDSGIPELPNGNVRNDGKSIIAAKHMSILEIAVISKVVPNTFFIMKRELLWIPIYGWAFWRCGMIGVNRARGKTNMTKLTEQVERSVLNGGTLVIFPEGTRSRDGNLLRPKSGMMIFSTKTHSPIFPAAIATKDGKVRPFRKTVVCFGDPITPEELGLTGADSPAELRNASRKVMDIIATLREEALQEL